MQNSSSPSHDSTSAEVARPRRRWPDRSIVHQALSEWAAEAHRAHPDLKAVGYFGSYGRGDFGVGSDLDVVILDASAVSDRVMRGLAWDLNELPVPVDLIVYTPQEWRALRVDERGFALQLRRDVCWVWSTPEQSGE